MAEKELAPLINELAKSYKTDHKLADDAAAAAQITEKLANSQPKSHGTTVCHRVPSSGPVISRHVGMSSGAGFTTPLRLTKAGRPD